MKIKFLALFVVFFMACSVVQFAAPVAAAPQKGYLVDHGTKIFYDGVSGAKMKVKWKTYLYPNNMRKVERTYYEKINGKWKYSNKWVVTFKKVSKTKLWMSCSSDYINTKLSTRWFYWKIFRPDIEEYPQ